MVNALVVRARRYRKIGDKTSPLVYALKRKPRDVKVYDLKCIVEKIEALDGMSAEDMLHVGKAIVRNIHEELADGSNIRLDDFRIFHTSLHCVAAELEKDCTVKNIDKVRANFKIAGMLRLANDSVAITKGVSNNVTYKLVSTDGGDSSGGTGGLPDDGREEDPLG